MENTGVHPESYDAANQLLNKLGFTAENTEATYKGKCKPQSSGVFINLVSNLERAGDHLNYIVDVWSNKGR